MTSDSPSSSVDSGARPCGLLRRLLAMTYDSMVVIALWMFAAALVLPLGAEEWVAGRHPLYTLYLASVWFIYVVWCWHAGGMTLGMRAWRIDIESPEGRRPDWRACALRFGVAIVSTAALGLGFLTALVDPRRRTWHDRVSNTRLWYRPPIQAALNQTDRRST